MIKPITCKHCKTQFNANSNKNYTPQFCSKHCSHSCRKHSQLTKDKISTSLRKTNELIVRDKKILKVCPICSGNFFIYPSYRNKIYCSKVCYTNDREFKFRKKTSGGYRVGSGRGKSGYYKGIYCQSTYELCWVIYMLDHNIAFERFKKAIKNNELTYYPDFILSDGTIIEIKGYEDIERVEKKTNAAINAGYKIKILWRDNLQHIFDYVTITYKTKDYASLYDKAV